MNYKNILSFFNNKKLKIKNECDNSYDDKKI